MHPCKKGTSSFLNPAPHNTPALISEACLVRIPFAGQDIKPPNSRVFGGASQAVAIYTLEGSDGLPPRIQNCQGSEVEMENSFTMPFECDTLPPKSAKRLAVPLPLSLVVLWKFQENGF